MKKKGFGNKSRSGRSHKRIGVIILGAGGRDFHNFNLSLRWEFPSLQAQIMSR